MSDSKDKQVEESEARGLRSVLPWSGAMENGAYVMRDRHGRRLFSEGHLKPIVGDYIVQSCNAHDALVEALKFVQERCTLYGAANAAREKIDDALALARDPEKGESDVSNKEHTHRQD